MRTNKPNFGSDLEREIVVKGVTVGNLTPGTTLEQGMTLTEVFEKMLMKYAGPSVSLSPAQTYEAGTVLMTTISPSYNKNDGGLLTRYLLTRNGVTVIDQVELQGYDETATIGDNTISYQGTFYHAASDSVDSGSLTASTTITGKRKAFYGVNGAVSTSANIRAFSGSLLGPVNGTQFTITIPAGTTSVEFAYPATLRDVTTVKHLETNFDVKEVFSKITLNVAGDNAFSPVAYKVYRYVPAAAFTGAAKYTVTI